MDSEVNYSGMWVPHFLIIDENLTVAERDVLSVIYTLSTNGGCFASNEYFAAMLRLKVGSVSNTISRLKNKGYISVKQERDGALYGNRLIFPINNGTVFKEKTFEKKPKKTKHFQKPTVQEIRDYVDELSGSIDAERFYDHYESNGWRVGGKSPMKDWKATVRNWEKNNKERVQQNQPKKNLNFDDLELDEYGNLKGVF